MKIKLFLKQATAVTMAIMLMLTSMSVIAFAEESAACEHIWDDGVETVAATCKEAGEMTFACSLCGEIKTEEIAALSHIAATIQGTPATCTQAGLSDGKYCSVCNDVLVEQTEIPVTDHNYGDGVVITAPSCTQVGAVLYTCADCGNEKTVELGATEHDYDYENGEITVDATCEVAGEIIYGCKDCDATKTEEIAMKEHSVAVDEAVEATCSATGLTEGSHCSVCNSVLVAQETVEMKPHTEVVAPGVAATCVNPGMSDEISCSVCGELIKEAELIKPTGHSFTEQVVDLAHMATEATCIKVATYYFDCANCDEMGTYAFEYGEKNSANHVNTEVIGKLDPTCTTSGYEEYTYCLDCKTSLNKVDKVALGHKFVLSETVAPTCTENGYEIYVCENDPTHTYTDNYIAALGHTPVTDERVEPTCISLGYEEGSHCSVCDEVLVAQEELPMLEHDYAGELKANEGADTHSSKCINGCEGYGNTENCTDEDDDCECDICGDHIAHVEVIDEKVEPTCTESGLEEGKHCEVCGEVIAEQTVIDALGHDFTDWSVTKAPTCTDTGEKVRMCKRSGCNYTEKAEVEADGHKETIIPGTPASCTTMGIEDAKYCAVCDTYYEGGGRINPLGHAPAVDAAVPATCLTTGLTEGSHCSRENCGVILVAQEVTDVLEHEYIGEIKAEENDTHSYKCVNGCNEYGGTVSCVDEDSNCICDDCEDAIAHVVVVVPEIPAKCEETGESEWEYCDVCGETLKEKEILEKTGHKYVVDKEIPATCTESGLSDGIHCEWCGLVVTEQQVIPATGHVNKSIVAGYAATCTEPGKTAGVICSDCETVLTAQETIPAVGHNEDGILEAVDATCTTAGKTEGKYCTKCNTTMVEQESTPALDHDYEEIPYTAPTCTTEGQKAGTYCKRCEKVLNGGEVIPVLEHAFSENWTIDIEETCIDNGEKSHHCTNAGCAERIDVTAIPAKGHTEEVLSKVEPTCTQTGLEEGKKCSACDEVLVEQVVIPATGHRFNEDEWTTVTEATCTQAGEKTNVCLNCNETISEVIEMLPHSPVVDPAVPASCISFGYEGGSHCEVCNEVLAAPIQLPMLEHSYEGEIIANDNDTHSYKCVNGCEEYGKSTPCVDDNSDCICDECEDEIAHVEAIDEAKDATCVETGLTQGSHCEVCGATIVQQEEIPTIEHSYTGEVSACENDAHKFMCVNGCEEYGEAVACVDEDADCVCDVCLDGIAHQFDEAAWETTVEADCTTVGSRNNNCIVCGENVVEEIVIDHSYTGEVKASENDTHSYKCVNGCEEYGEAIPCVDEDNSCVCDICEDAIAHKTVIVPEVAAKCDEDGATEWEYCEVCGVTLKEKETVPMLGHKYEGSCRSKNDGTHEFECINGCGEYGGLTECSDNNSDCICDDCGYAIPHSFDSDWIVSLAPTCLAEGEKINQCVVCEEIIRELVPVIEHSYTGELKAEDNDKHSYKCVNGCEEYGNATGCSDENRDCICDVCEDAIAHVEIVDAAKEATCTETGLTEGKHCDVCKTVIAAQETVDKKAHTSDKGTVTKTATCTATGTKIYKCTECGVVIKSEAVAMVAHKEIAIPAVAATYTKTGLTAGKKCSVCGKITVAQKTVAKKTLGKVEDLTASKVKVATSSSITLTWDKVDGAEKYEVYQYVSKKWKKIKTTSKTSLTIKKLKANKSYKFKVRAVRPDDEVKGKYSSTLTVKTVPATTSKLTLKAGKKQLTASWSKVSDISGYEVQYSTSKKMKNSKTVNVKKSSKKTTIKKLTKGKKYYVRVRTYKIVNGKKVYSSWSTVKNVKAK